MNSKKLNELIKLKSNGNNNLAYHFHQMFFFEHFLLRLEKSKYKNNIILKGGVLLSSIIGEDFRTTKDIDTTLKSVPLNMDNIKEIFNEILNIELNDNVYFKIIDIKDIRLEDEYGGFKINVLGIFDKIKTNFFIEITTGDIITPREIKYNYNSIFEDKKINIMAYNIETIISEKFHSIISKNIFNTRAKDYYDIYMLVNNEVINTSNLYKAVKNPFKKRKTLFDIDFFKETVNLIENNKNLKDIYAIYQKKLEYTKKVTYKNTINALKKIIYILEKESKIN